MLEYQPAAGAHHWELQIRRPVSGGSRENPSLRTQNWKVWQEAGQERGREADGWEQVYAGALIMY